MQITKERAKRTILSFLVSGLPAALVNRDKSFNRESVSEWVKKLECCGEQLAGSAEIFVRGEDVFLVRRGGRVG